MVNLASPGARFDTTRWSIVLACGGDNDAPETQQALANLFQTYWYPLYAYVRRRGYNEQDAQDLVQTFCSRLYEKHAMAKADPLRGKFRTFLLTALQNFLANEHERTHRQKRGGEFAFVPLQTATAEARYEIDPPHSETPESLFEKQWAHALLEQTLAAVRTEFIARGKERLFEGLAQFLSPEAGDESYVAAAQRLGLPLSAIKTAVHRLRVEYRERLRAEIGRTVSTSEEIDDELQHLRRVLANAA